MRGPHPILLNAVGDLSDFKLGRNFFADALQFAVLFEGFDPVAQIVVGQGGVLLMLRFIEVAATSTQPS